MLNLQNELAFCRIRKYLIQTNENKQKEAMVGPIFKKVLTNLDASLT